MSGHVPPPAPALPPGHPLRRPNRVVVTPDLRKHVFAKDPWSKQEPPRYQCQTCGLETLKPEERLDALVKCEPADDFVSVLLPPPKVKPIKWKRPVDPLLVVPTFWTSWRGTAVFAIAVVLALALLWYFL